MNSALSTNTSHQTMKITPYWDTEQFAEALHTVVADATKHNFHAKALLGMLLVFKRLGQSMCHLIVWDEKGWALCSTYGNTTGHIEIEYVFVKPEYRRQGWFSHLVKNVVSPINGGRGVQIGCAVQRSPELFRAICSGGFTLWEEQKVSLNKKELLFLWKCPHTPPSELFNEMTERIRAYL